MTAGHGRTADGGHGRDAGEGTVDRAFAAALYSDDDTGLDTGASLLAADPDADTELGRRGEDLLTTAWRRGWQPADVVRMVRRELTDAQERLTILLIGRETPRHDPLPPRWDGQLRALGARPAASAPGDPLPRAPATTPTASPGRRPFLSCTGCCCGCPPSNRSGPCPVKP